MSRNVSEHVNSHAAKWSKLDAVCSLKSFIFKCRLLVCGGSEPSLRHIYLCVYVDSSEQLKIFLLRNGFYKISSDYVLVVCSYGWT